MPRWGQLENDPPKAEKDLNDEEGRDKLGRGGPWDFE